VIFFRRNQEKTLIEAIKDDLKKRKLHNKGNVALTKEEKALIREVKKQTIEWNKNNVTRTKAYLDFYVQHPEIHWAFLGHMVSRNGGWNMTDLKGEIHSKLLSNKEKRAFFAFLERGNWLIFQDAYPQFLLYQESLKRNKPYFHLLSVLNVSVFMESCWNYFWEHHATSLLAIALIINEQNYLEKRVIQNPLYKNEVLNSLEFKLQDVLSFNHILFPYMRNNVLRLAGQTLHHFDSVHERIMLGKRLYAVLFKDKEILRNAEKWAMSTPHTGSRKDFWPHIFNNVHEGIPGKSYQLRLKSCTLRPGASRIYSPNLQSAWRNVKHVEAEEGDWLKDDRVLEYFSELEEPFNGEIENEYCKTLEMLELAAFAKKAISVFD
jgi:hypothetical protein